MEWGQVYCHSFGEVKTWFVDVQTGSLIRKIKFIKLDFKSVLIYLIPAN